MFFRSWKCENDGILYFDSTTMPDWIHYKTSVLNSYKLVRRKTYKQNSKIVNQNTFKSIHLPFFIFRFIKFHTKRKNILSTITQRNSYMYLWNKKYKTKQGGYIICHTHNHACICSIYKAALTTKQKQQRQLTLYIYNLSSTWVKRSLSAALIPKYCGGSKIWF